MPWNGTIFTSQILGKTSLIADYVTKVLRPCGKASLKVMFYFRTAMLSSKELILSHRKTAATGGSNAMSQYWKEAVLPEWQCVLLTRRVCLDNCFEHSRITYASLAAELRLSAHELEKESSARPFRSSAFLLLLLPVLA